VYRVLDALDTDQRIAFALRFVAGMELTEVAASCGVSLATIKRRLSRAQINFAALAKREPALAEWLKLGASNAQNTERGTP
jgi:RNA polymerase sigma-70 factor, ECF subfamily